MLGVNITITSQIDSHLRPQFKVCLTHRGHRHTDKNAHDLPALCGPWVKNQ
jgi:hypothetical protein